MQRPTPRTTTTLLVSALALALPRTALAQDQGTSVSPTGKGIVGGALLGGEAVMLTEAAFGVRPGWAYAVGGIAGGALGGFGGYMVEQAAADPATDAYAARPSMYLLLGGMVLIIPTTVAVLSATAYQPPVNFTEDQPPSDRPSAAYPARQRGQARVCTAPASPPGAVTAPSERAAISGPSDASAVAQAKTGHGTATSARSAAPPPSRTCAARLALGQGGAAQSPPSRAARTYRAMLAERAPLRAPALPPALLAYHQGSRQLSLSVPALQLRSMYTRTELAIFGVHQRTEVHLPVVSVVF